MIQITGTVYPHPAFGTGRPPVPVYQERGFICLYDMIPIQLLMKIVIKNLFKIRHHLYMRASDVRVDGDKDAQNVAKYIKEDFCK